MTVLLRILIVLCSLMTAAHFLRFGTLWDAAPALLALPAAFFPRFLPRPLLALGLLGAHFCGPSTGRSWPRCA